MPEKVLRALYLLETGTSVQNLEALTAAERELSQQGVTTASSMTNGFEAIEDRVGAMFKKISEGRSVSDAELRSLAVRFVSLSDEITRAFGSIEKAPLEWQIALKTSESQIVALNKAVVDLGSRADEAASRFKTLATESGAAAVGITEQSKSAAEAIGQLTQSAGAVERGMMSIADASSLVEKSVAAAWKKDSEGARLTERDITNVLENVERLRLAIVAEAGSFEKANAAQISGYKAAEAEAQRLIERTNLLKNAAQDHALGLKEEGAQLQNVGLLAQQIGGIFGQTGQAVGNVAAQAGNLGGIFESLKDTVKALNLNTLDASAAGSTLAIQFAAVVAVAVAATAAGVKLAETEEGNAGTIRDLGNTIKSFSLDLKNELVGSLNDAQRAGQNVAATLFNVGEDLARLDFQRARESSHGLTEEILKFDLVLNHIPVDLRAWNAAQEAGLSMMGRFMAGMTNLRIATEQARLEQKTLADGQVVWQQGTEKSITLAQFHEQAMRSGSAGQKVWNQVVTEGYGDIQKLQDAMRKHVGELNGATLAMNQNTEAERKLAEMRQRSAEITRQAHDIERQHKEELMKASNVIYDEVAAEVENVIQTGKSTEALNAKIAAIEKYIPESEKHKIALKALAEETQALLDKDGDLTKAERERYQVIVDLAAKGGDLTEAEKRYVAELGNEIAAHQKAVGSAKERLDLINKTKSVTDDLVNAIKGEAAAAGIQETQTQKAARAAQEMLDANKNLSASERVRLEALIQTAKEMGALVAEKKRLTEANNETAQSEAAATAETERNSFVVGASQKTLDEEIKRKAELAEALAKISTTTAAVKTSTEQVTLSYKDGVPVISNISAEQQKLEDSYKNSAKEAQGAAAADTGLRTVMDGSKVVITNTADALRKAGDAGGDLAVATDNVKVSAQEAADLMRQHQTIMQGIGDATAAAKEHTESLADAVKRLKEETAEAREQLKLMNEEMKKTQSAADDACGDEAA